MTPEQKDAIRERLEEAREAMGLADAGTDGNGASEYEHRMYIGKAVHEMYYILHAIINALPDN